MTVRTISRFYKSVAVGENGGRFFVLLDGKPLKTPHRAVLALPKIALAEAIAEEWAAQKEKIDPKSMPLTQLANTAIALVPEHRGKAAEQILAYAKSELLCYRAEAPDELIKRQAEQWDPLLDWADAALGARLATGHGIAFVEQTGESLLALEKGRVAARCVWACGPPCRGHAHRLARPGARTGRRPIEGLGGMALAQLDETWQAEKWGRDAGGGGARGQAQDRPRSGRSLSAAARRLTLSSAPHSLPARFPFQSRDFP